MHRAMMTHVADYSWHQGAAQHAGSFLRSMLVSMSHNAEDKGAATGKSGTAELMCAMGTASRHAKIKDYQLS